MTLDPAQPDHWLDRTDAGSLTPYEADALTFSRAWLSGQTEFMLHTAT